MTIRDAPSIHERVASVYKHRRVSRDAKQISNRKDDVLIARLQTCHHSSLKQYLHRLDPSEDPTCWNCCQEEQNLLHWLCNCPALITVRQRVFGCHQGSLEWLATRPGDRTRKHTQTHTIVVYSAATWCTFFQDWAQLPS